MFSLIKHLITSKIKLLSQGSTNPVLCHELWLSRSNVKYARLFDFLKTNYHVKLH